MTTTHFHRTIHTASRIAGLLAVAAGLATVLPSAAHASGPSATLKAKFPEVTGIASQLTAGGTARVMVLLKAKTPASPDPNPGYEKTTATRDLASANKSARYYPKVALFAATAKLSELEKLAADTVVLKMQLDHVNARSTVVEETVDQSAATIGAGPAFLAGFDGTGQAIAVLDTGFQVDHPFFADKLIDEACFSNGDLLAGNASLCPAANAPHPAINCDPALDGCNHGTLVAGVAVGRLPDNISLTDKASRTGVGRGAKLIAVNVFTKVPNAQITGGYGLQAYDSDVIAALLWVDGKKDSYGATNIAAVNLSMAFGSLDGTVNCDATSAPAMKAVIDQLKTDGIATIVSAGHNPARQTGNKIAYPACISSAIAVSAVNSDNTLAVYSDMSPDTALLAPGTLIDSSVPGSAWGIGNGTSIAAAHVSGAFAILRQKAPNATVDQILAALKVTGTPTTDANVAISGGVTKPLIRVDLALGQFQNAN